MRSGREALCVAQQGQESFSMFFILGLNLFQQSMCDRSSDLGHCHYLPENLPHFSRKVIIRKTWLLKKFSLCSLHDCRDSVLLGSRSCMDRSKILFLFQPHNGKMDAHIFSLP